MRTQREITPQTAYRTQKLGGQKLWTGEGSPSQNVQATVSLRRLINKDSNRGGQIKKYLYIDFNHSDAGPGDLMFNQNDLRGAFIDRLIFKAWLQPANGGSGGRLAPVYSIYEDSSTTTNQSGSVTSSVKVDLSVTGGAGSGGATGGAGVNVSSSNSHSHELTDFTFLNKSDGSTLHHELPMQQLLDGKPYEGPHSLINEWQNPTIGARLRPLPNLSISNVPILSQVIWMNDRNSDLMDHAHLCVEIKARYQTVFATNNFFAINSRYLTNTVSSSFKFPIDFTIVDGTNRERRCR